MTSKDAYAAKALEQLPRILSNTDRNPLSRTFGCMHRDYWLYKTSDFSDAVRQFGMHAMALAFSRKMPQNPYYQNPKMRDWALAALDFWASLQHGDGSFDEFYPYERGWVGPTAFTTYTAVETLTLMAGQAPLELTARVREAVAKAARLICKGDKEEDHLANHHAMACLAVHKAHRLLGDDEFLKGYQKLWKGFLSYNRPEGWSIEYDGIDPGYLSATVSFFGKVYQDTHDPELLQVLSRSVEMCSYFAYPNGYYAGSMGSRNTLHFYPHGFEVLAPEAPMAGAVAEKMLTALSQGKLVPPGIMSDRYLGYRVPELMLSYLDHAPRAEELPPLPYERDEPFQEHFPEAGLWVKKSRKYFVLSNLAKGGVVKAFPAGGEAESLANDCGLIGRLSDGRVVTSQWIDEAYRVTAIEQGWEVEGEMHQVVAGKLFTIFKNLLFRSALMVLGPVPAFSHFLKGRIRKALILKQPTAPVRFKRTFSLSGDKPVLRDEIVMEQGARFEELKIGDEFFARYVPQSMFFQGQELGIQGRSLSRAELDELNSAGKFVWERSLD